MGGSQGRRWSERRLCGFRQHPQAGILSHSGCGARRTLQVPSRWTRLMRLTCGGAGLPRNAGQPGRAVGDTGLLLSYRHNGHSRHQATRRRRFSWRGEDGTQATPSPNSLRPTHRTQGALVAWTLGVQYRLLPCICPMPALVSSETWAHLLGIQSEGGQREAPATAADPHFLSKLPGGSPRSKGRSLTGAWAELGG